MTLRAVASGGGGGITIGTTTITGGATTQVLFNLGGVVSSSANLTFATPILTLGVAALSAQALIRVVAAAGQNQGFEVYEGASRSWYGQSTGSTGFHMNTPSGSMMLGAGNVQIITMTNTAGQGPAVTPSTATTDVAAFSVARTNNNAAVATGVKFSFTDTTSAAGFLPFQVLGGAAASTNLLSVSKAGLVDAPAYSAGGSAGVDFGPSVPTSITVKKGIVIAAS